METIDTSINAKCTHVKGLESTPSFRKAKTFFKKAYESFVPEASGRKGMCQ
jgi:hypothetical protein